MEGNATAFIRPRLEREGDSFALAENPLEGARGSAMCLPSTPRETSMPERIGFVGLGIMACR